MKYFSGFLTLLIILSFSITSVADDSINPQVEELKKQILEMQKQNEEMIRKIQEENNKRINVLYERINE